MLAATLAADTLMESPRQMGVTRRRLDLRVAKQPCDQRQGLAECQRPAGKGVPKVMDPNILKGRSLPHPIPLAVKTVQARAGLASRDDPGIVRRAGKAREDPRRRRRQGNHTRASLAVAKPDLARLQVHILPAQREDLVDAAFPAPAAVRFWGMRSGTSFTVSAVQIPGVSWHSTLNLVTHDNSYP